MQSKPERPVAPPPPNRDTNSGRIILRDDGDSTCGLLRPETPQVVVEADQSRCGPQRTVAAAQQRRLAAAVGSDEADELAGCHDQVGLCHDRASAELDGDTLQDQPHAAFTGASMERRRNSHRKKGTPKTVSYTHLTLPTTPYV